MGKIWRTEKLTDSKQELRRLMSKVPESRIRYADHIEQHGTALFQRVCKMDLEGIVAKHSLAPYRRSARRGSRSRIGTTVKCKDVRNSSDANGTGPQASGILIGREELIHYCLLNMSPQE